MPSQKSATTLSKRLLLTSILLTTLSVSSAAFAQSQESATKESQAKSEKRKGQLLETTHVSEFKMWMRSILSSEHKKKCSPGYAVRVSSETARTWFDQAFPGGGEGYEYFMKEMTPDDESTIAAMAVFVQDLEYPILLVYKKGDIPMYLNLNKFKFKDDLKVAPDGCHKNCSDFIAQELEKQSSKKLCYTVNEEDKTTLIGELEVGVGFNL